MLGGKVCSGVLWEGEGPLPQRSSSRGVRMACGAAPACRGCSKLGKECAPGARPGWPWTGLCRAAAVFPWRCFLPARAAHQVTLGRPAHTVSPPCSFLLWVWDLAERVSLPACFPGTPGPEGTPEPRMPRHSQAVHFRCGHLVAPDGGAGERPARCICF